MNLKTRIYSEFMHLKYNLKKNTYDKSIELQVIMI